MTRRRSDQEERGDRGTVKKGAAVGRGEPPTAPPPSRQSPEPGQTSARPVAPATTENR